MAEWSSYLTLAAAGFVAGTLNVIAGGGSFLTLPILIFFGLPPVVANGTNRVGILVQNIGAVWSFHRHRVLPWTFLAAAGIPSMLGGIVGTVAALNVPDASFKKILAFLMVVISLWSLWDPLRKQTGASEKAPRTAALAAGFFLVGIYGGFVQAGVGFFLLAATTLAGLDLVRGNAVKVLSVLLFTSVSLALFAWQGKVVWHLGLALAAGNLLGGLLGVRLTVLRGHAWIKTVVTLTIIFFAIKLWLG